MFQGDSSIFFTIKYTSLFEEDNGFSGHFALFTKGSGLTT